jgi:hypothetical protein
MADLDAELLALAGDDSSGEEGSIPTSPADRDSQSRHSRSLSPRRESMPSDTGRKSAAQTVKKARSRKPARRSRYSDDDDDEYV